MIKNQEILASGLVPEEVWRFNESRVCILALHKKFIFILLLLFFLQALFLDGEKLAFGPSMLVSCCNLLFIQIYPPTYDDKFLWLIVSFELYM